MRVQTVITVFQWATYHNADNFHDPDSFRPERWLPTNHELYEPVFANDNKQCFRK
jgi:cytochrome P450